MVQNLLMVLGIILLWRKTEKIDIRKMGLTKLSTGKSKGEFIKGLALGAASIAVAFVVLLLTNQIKIADSSQLISF